MLCTADSLNLQGEIPTENGLLTTLTSFELQNNRLDGSIPTELCLLTNLKSFNLGQNSMAGEIPQCVQQWSSLTQLSLHENHLRGSLPPTLGSLRQLTRLFLSGNALTGDPTTIFSSLSGLVLLLANSNQFEAQIEDPFLLHHDSLTWLDLSGNDLYLAKGRQAGLPAHLLSLPRLQLLDLSNNRLRGTLPAGLGNNTVLQYLSLYNNDLNGGVSALTHLRALRHLDVSRNAFAGSVPAEFNLLTNLRLLYLGDNKFDSGPVPSFANLPSLEDLSLRKISRNGTFNPADLPPSLVYLDLGGNKLTGVVPASLGDLTELDFLMLNANPGLNGTLPATVSRLHQLRAVFLDGTGIEGNLSSVVCTLPKFTTAAAAAAPATTSNARGGATATAAYADCKGTAAAVDDCTCCQCCDRAVAAARGCSDGVQGLLRQQWAVDFQSLTYTITNDTVAVNRDYIPPVHQTLYSE